MATGRNGGGNSHHVSEESFERSFESLQEVVRKLSEGNLTLQEALSAFEEGMALADRCGDMLEEAELRVKQVSERAMRAGNAAARDVASAISALDMDEPELTAFEIETFESTILFEPLDNRGSTRSSNSGLGRGPASGQNSQTGKKESAPGRDTPPARKPPSILDPLFDEDD
ncbi:MAG TPA: exodeoxyribonuclease VII small subunit [Chloroflexia bacterium]|nr:exodeoxyribonuclease VII small subunit [Chloroflexia bacterium]